VIRRVIALLTVLVVGVLVGPQPAFADPIRDAQWHLEYLNIAAAHEYTRGEGITVAVVDSGADRNHPDLAGSLVPGKDFTPDVQHYGDSLGYTDVGGHGTAMAGLIAAHGRTLGIAPAAKIQPVRVFIGDGFRFDGNGVAEGIQWAAEHGAQVMNLSLGATDDNELRAAIETAQRNDIVVVAAAGNPPEDINVAYPAAYPGVLAVAGIDRNGTRKSSVIGPEVMIAAPGVEIMGLNRDGGFGVGTGTSGATAIVSGAVALIRSRYPQLTAPEVIDLITSTADDAGQKGRDPEYGYGILNIVRALRTPPPTHTTAPTAAPPAPATGSHPWPWITGIAIALLITAGGLTAARRRATHPRA
jgi:type VII secretion-associated serine protease mycosin